MWYWLGRRWLEEAEQAMSSLLVEAREAIKWLQQEAVGKEISAMY